jgi:hypothetical protein
VFVLFTTLFTTSAPVILGGLNIKLTSEICNDGIDNDNDGDFDLDDSDCAETNCIDGIDNNFNGFTDCDDPNCQEFWPYCIYLLSLSAIEPQLNCQGSLTLTGESVVCNQIRGFTPYDFFSVSTFRGNNDLRYMGTIGITGQDSMEDTMINCDSNTEVDYSNSKFLKVNGYNAGSTSYKMLQRFKFTDEVNTLTSLYTVKNVFLFQKGNGFGKGESKVYPAISSWYEHNVTCDDRGTSFIGANGSRMIAAPMVKNGIPAKAISDRY